LNCLLIYPWYPYSSVSIFEEPLGILYITSALLQTRHDQSKAKDRLDSNADYSGFEPTRNIYRLHMPMKVDHVSASDISKYRDRINNHMKSRVLLRCMLDFRIWTEILFSRSLRTIAFNFIRRHFNLRGWKVRPGYPMTRSVRQKLK
jgi:hypothetical protein